MTIRAIKIHFMSKSSLYLLLKLKYKEKKGGKSINPLPYEIDFLVHIRKKDDNIHK